MRIGLARTSECTFTLSQIRGAEVRRRNASRWRPVSCCTELSWVKWKESKLVFFFFFFIPVKCDPRHFGILVFLAHCVWRSVYWDALNLFLPSQIIWLYADMEVEGRLSSRGPFFAEIAQYQCKGHPSRRHLLDFFIVSVEMGYKQWNKMAITVVYWLVRGAPSSSWPPM